MSDIFEPTEEELKIADICTLNDIDEVDFRVIRIALKSRDEFWKNVLKSLYVKCNDYADRISTIDDFSDDTSMWELNKTITDTIQQLIEENKDV